MTFRIATEWLDAPGVTDAGLASTWARTSITVGPRALELYDQKRKAVRDGFFGSVLPFVEWLVDAWGRLINERAKPAPASPDFRVWSGYHSFHSGREGGAMPDVWLRRIDNDWFHVRAIADERLMPGISVRFFLDAHEQVAANQVERVLGELITATCEQLAHSDPSHADRLLGKWSSRLRPASQLIGRLGLDEDDLTDVDIALVNELLNEDAQTLVEIAEAIPGTLSERVSRARTIAGQLPQATSAPDQWRRLLGRAHSRREHPWQTGWAAAADFRALLELPSTHVFASGLPAFLETQCGWATADQVHRLHGDFGSVRTVFLWGDHVLPTVVTTATESASKRFRTSKALYYSLFGASTGARATTVDSPVVPMYSEANAFAAELLAPAEFLRTRTPSDGVWERQHVASVARELAVSPMVVQHQIENRRIGSVSS